jgi:hypothetical protein
MIKPWQATQLEEAERIEWARRLRRRERRKDRTDNALMGAIALLLAIAAAIVLVGM